MKIYCDNKGCIYLVVDEHGEEECVRDVLKFIGGKCCDTVDTIDRLKSLCD